MANSGNPFSSRRREHITDYLGGRTIGPQMMSDERWEEVKERFKDREQTCAMCKKKFLPPSIQDWAYKDTKHVFCSWKCLRAYEKR